MKITYYIEDGYAGGSRPHYVTVDDVELEECESHEEKIKLVTEVVQEHFEQNICPYWDQTQLFKR